MSPEDYGSKAKAGISFDAYYTMVGAMQANGETSGKDQSETMIHFTKLNFARMNRVVKTFRMADGMHTVLKKAKPQTWILLTESWCGDAATNLPTIAMLADAVQNIQLKVLFRDEHLDLMDEILTNGARSIPKLISLDTEGNKLFTWGPRPEFAQKMVMDNKALPESERKDYNDLNIELQKWYAKDRSQTLQAEFKKLLETS